MAVSDIEAVIEFLRKNGFSESESALREDVKEKSQLGSTDFERFLFPMVPPPPRLKIPATSSRLPQASSGGDAVDHASSLSSSEEEFVSLDSSTTEFCSSGDFLPSKFPFFFPGYFPLQCIHHILDMVMAKSSTQGGGRSRF